MTSLLINKEEPKFSDTSSPLTGEVVASCPGCTALQTLWFIEGRLTPTRKFSQYADRVFHDCGSIKPCRLYRSY